MSKRKSAEPPKTDAEWRAWVRERERRRGRNVRAVVYSKLTPDGDHSAIRQHGGGGGVTRDDDNIGAGGRAVGFGAKVHSREHELGPALVEISSAAVMERVSILPAA
jgi:hypothetical protein